MSVHTIIALLVLYCAVRALLRHKPADPMAGRLVARPAFTPTTYQRESIETLLERDRQLRAKVAAPIDRLAAYRPANYDELQRQHFESLKINPETRH